MIRCDQAIYSLRPSYYAFCVKFGFQNITADSKLLMIGIGCRFLKFLKKPYVAIHGHPPSSNSMATPPTTTKMSVFPRAIADRPRGFSCPPKLGTRRQRRGSSSNQASPPIPTPASAITTPITVTATSTQVPTITTMPHFPHDHTSSSTIPAFVPKTTKIFITRIFLTMPANTQWSSSVTSIAHWPIKLSHVLVSLEDSTRWASVTFPQPFPPNIVEFHVAKAFGSHFQNQTSESGISGSFFK
jgi:hypothetical protein